MPGAGISKALTEVSLDGKTVPSCADTNPSVATHVVKTSSNSFEAAMTWGSSSDDGLKLSVTVAMVQAPSRTFGFDGDGDGDGGQWSQ